MIMVLPVTLTAIIKQNKSIGKMRAQNVVDLSVDDSMGCL